MLTRYSAGHPETERKLQVAGRIILNRTIIGVKLVHVVADVDQWRARAHANATLGGTFLYQLKLHQLLKEIPLLGTGCS
jgi:hypothetical protein